MVDAPPRAAPELTAEERADIGTLVTELPALRQQLQELDLLIQQNMLETESQRLRLEAAQEALRQLERSGGFSREQYQETVTKVHQTRLRHLSAEHQDELLQSKKETIQQLADVAQFALVLAARLDPDAVDPALVIPAPAPEPPPQEAGRSASLPPPSESAIIEAQEEERSWIARQLHNGPAQSLTNLILRAEICERMVSTDLPGAVRELHDLRDTVHRTLQDMRRFIFDVRPMILDDLGLAPALRRFIDDWNAQNQHGAVTLTVLGTERRFARSKELAIFRIVQDAVKTSDGKTGEHATAAQVLFEDRAIRVTLESPLGGRADAAPLPDAPLPPGYQMIQQRAATIGGTAGLEVRANARVLSVTVPTDQ